MVLLTTGAKSVTLVLEAHPKSQGDYGTVLHPPLGSTAKEDALPVAGAAVGLGLKEDK